MSSAFGRVLLTALAAVLAVSVIPTTPADAYYVERTQVPGKFLEPNRGEAGGGSRYRCGSTTSPFSSGGTLWRREASGVWRVEIPSYPTCTNEIEVVVNRQTGETQTFRANRPGVDWGNAGEHAACPKYFEVLRFYGPRTEPARNVTRSVITPSTPCAQVPGWSVLGPPSTLGLVVPHPHDANRYPSDPVYRTSGKYATTGPLSEAWQPQATNSSGHRCPLPDDNLGLADYFATNWPTEAEATMAKDFRKGLAEAYVDLFRKTRRANLPDSTARRMLNASGFRSFPGDGFTTLDYSDGIPCSSPLDFAVPHGSTPWVYGVCVAPVYTAYRGPVYTRQDGQVYYGAVEAFPDAWYLDLYRKITGRSDAQLPEYGVEAADLHWRQSGLPEARNDSVVRAYRTRAASILGRTDQFQFRVPSGAVDRASQMAQSLPCSYGVGPVEPASTTPPAREPVDPIAITGPSDALAYVGGIRTEQTFRFDPHGAITCRGGRACTQGQVLREVVYSPQIAVPSGWTRCTSSNRASCDYDYSWSRSSDRTTLHVTLRTYTATRPREVIRILPRGSAIVEYTAWETKGSGILSFSTVHTTRGFAAGLGNITVPYVPGASQTLQREFTVSTSPQPARIQVAGSRLTTDR